MTWLFLCILLWGLNALLASVLQSNKVSGPIDLNRKCVSVKKVPKFEMEGSISLPSAVLSLAWLESDYCDSSFEELAAATLYLR